MTKTIQIRSTPTFIVPMTAAEVAVLKLCADHHYDRTCQLMNQPFKGPGTRNGLLVIWQQNVESSLMFDPNDTPTVSASFKDLDLCLKVMERPPLEKLNDEQKSLLRALSGAFHRALQDANQMALQWTGQSVYESPSVAPTPSTAFSAPTDALTTPRRSPGMR